MRVKLQRDMCRHVYVQVCVHVCRCVHKRPCPGAGVCTQWDVGVCGAWSWVVWAWWGLWCVCGNAQVHSVCEGMQACRGVHPRTPCGAACLQSCVCVHTCTGQGVRAQGMWGCVCVCSVCLPCCAHTQPSTCAPPEHACICLQILHAHVHGSVCVRFASVCAWRACSQGVPGTEQAWALSCVCVCTHVPHSMHAAGVCTGMGSPPDAHMEGVRAQGVCCRHVGARGTQWGTRAQGCVAVWRCRCYSKPWSGQVFPQSCDVSAPLRRETSPGLGE